MLNQSKYIKLTQFKNLVFWDYYTLCNKLSIESNYPIVELKEVISQRKKFVTIEDQLQYKRCRVQLYGNGVVLRDEVYGSAIKTKKQQLCKHDDFLVAEIDAKFGGYGIVPSSLEGAIVSGHYFLFNIDKLKLSPDFLGIISKCDGFSKQVKATGSTNYAAIRPYHVLGYKIPLPSLVEQNALVAAYNDLIETANNQELQAKSLEQQIEAYLLSMLKIKKQHKAIEAHGLQFISYKKLHKWAISEIFKSSMYSFDDVEFELKSVGQLLTFFEGGKTPSTSRKDYWGNDIYWASAKDMKELYLTTISDKISYKGADESGLKIYPEGTILGVFRSGILRHSFPICLTMVPTTINQDLKAIGVNESVVLKQYFLLYLNIFQSLVLERSQKKGATVESVNTDDFKSVPIVCPPIEVQNKIVNYISRIKEQINTLRIEAAANRTEALLKFEQKIFK